MRPRPCCVECKCSMKAERNGFHVRYDNSGGPYQIWSGDKWKCPKCGKEIVYNWGKNPWAEYHEPHFKETQFDIIVDGEK